MRKMPRQLFAFFRKLFDAWNENYTWIYAAALSFFTMFSLAPLLIIAMAVGGMVAGESTTRQEIFSRVNEFAGAQAENAIRQVVANISQPRASLIAGIIGFIAVLLGASGVFWQLRIALNTIAHLQFQRNTRQTIRALIRTQLLAFALSLSTGLLVLVSLAAGTVVSTLTRKFPNLLPGGIDVWKYTEFAGSLALVTLLFSMLFQYVPERRIRWRYAFAGGIFAAILFMAGKVLIEVYLSTTTIESAYGAAGSLVVFMIWLYYSAAVLLLGGEFAEALKTSANR